MKLGDVLTVVGFCFGAGGCGSSAPDIPEGQSIQHPLGIKGGAPPSSSKLADAPASAPNSAAEANKLAQEAMRKGGSH